jgi:hypothetical protein
MGRKTAPIFGLLALLIGGCLTVETPNTIGKSPASTSNPKMTIDITPKLEPLEIQTLTPTLKPTSFSNSTLNPRFDFSDGIRYAVCEMNNCRSTEDYSTFSIPDGCEGKLLSPDKKTLACIVWDKHDSTLILSNIKIQKSFSVSVADIVGKFELDNEFPRGFSPEFYSIDSNFIYFSTYIPVSGGGGLCFTGFGSEGLYRLDLKSGEVTQVIQQSRSFDVYTDFHVSKTGRRLAYDIPGGVAILDLKTGEKQIHLINGFSNRGFQWSPDGMLLAFSTDNSGMEGNVGGDIFVIDIKNGSIDPILHSDNACLFVMGWNENNEIEIVQEHPWEDTPKILKYNYSTGLQIIESLGVTPTP